MLYSLNAGEVPMPRGEMYGKAYLHSKHVWRYKHISKAATSAHSTSHLLEGFQKMTVQPHAEGKFFFNLFELDFQGLLTLLHVQNRP